MEFDPSHLDNVGPQGATAILLLAGDYAPSVSPSSGKEFNSSLFIDASGSTNGLTGESVIALNEGHGSAHALQTP
jgi:hypothetical protein